MNFTPITELNDFRARKSEALSLLECLDYQDFKTVLKSIITNTIDPPLGTQYIIKLESNNEAELQRIADFVNLHIGLECHIEQKPDGYYFHCNLR
ncbi:MAG TPA: hypothetical protein DIT04_11285 [Dysgonomonas sp.]|nr:hypothetical protein [Dysgonomonas sp.]